MIELPKPKNAPGVLSDSVFVTELEVQDMIIGIRLRKARLSKQFDEFVQKYRLGGRDESSSSNR